ncbi:MAG: site-specific integrase [bacterium]|nr:site-specific integrase [bacterium]MCM1373954.1 site-specific integrase [Muribaculum sp.]
MSRDKKRRDSKGRLLRTGEQQKPDGRFMYAYRDRSKKMHYVYSWKLEPTDKLPAGKRPCKALRELEKEIQKSLNEDVAYHGGDVTVLELVEKHVSLRGGVRHNTKAGYKTVLNILKKEAFGARRIDLVKTSDAKAWMKKLQKKDGRSYSSIHSIRGVLRPAFQMAVEDDLLKKNPFDWELGKVIDNDSKKREAITLEQEKAFLEFIKQDKHYSNYYESMFILFNTGMRISEFCGLTLADLDMENKRIYINHQLQRTRDGIYYIERTKTGCGNRRIKMSNEVFECFQKLIEKRKKPKTERVVDGMSGFLVLDKDDNPCLALHWEHYFKYALGKYNRTHGEKLPKITPHVCRHTFCTLMAKTGMKPNSLQYIMGHADIKVTLGYYTHFKAEDAEEEMEKIEADRADDAEKEMGELERKLSGDR